MTDKLDDKALSHLTPAERELLADDDALLEPLDAKESAPETAHDSASRADHGGDEEELPNDPAPILDTRAPEDLPQRLVALDEQKAELVSRFDDGELTAREYSDALEAIADQRDDVRWQSRRAEFAREQQEQAIEHNWNREVESYMRGPAKDITAKGEAALLAFDAYVKKITADPANARLSDKAQLAKAHKLFLADFDGFGRLPASRSPRAYEPEPGSRADHSRDAADFAALDRLAETDPRAYERRISRMSADERQAYGID
ncbi:MAG: hypothetical protein EKK29_05975 [Hyphomicrobiales bacterium]|nr:MAG: hypothetical protein EKK29_05975 [Hyphomicrobiales bacterium]